MCHLIMATVHWLTFPPYHILFALQYSLVFMLNTYLAKTPWGAKPPWFAGFHRRLAYGMVVLLASGGLSWGGEFKNGGTGNALCIPGRHDLFAVIRLLGPCPHLNLTLWASVERLFSGKRKSLLPGETLLSGLLLGNEELCGSALVSPWSTCRDFDTMD